jgi:hypothetical protein
MTGLIDELWDVALLGGHRRDQVRNISTDVLRQVIKVAALWAALTVARPGAAYRIGPPAIGAANRLIEDCRSPEAKPFRERHDLGSVIEITVRAAV